MTVGGYVLFTCLLYRLISVPPARTLRFRLSKRSLHSTETRRQFYSVTHIHTRTGVFIQYRIRIFQCNILLLLHFINNTVVIITTIWTCFATMGARFYTQRKCSRNRRVCRCAWIFT